MFGERHIRFKVWIVSMVVFLILSPYLMHGAQGEEGENYESNLLKNLDFEKSSFLNSNKPEGWETLKEIRAPFGDMYAICEWDNKVFHSGKRSVKLKKVNRPKTAGWIQRVSDLEAGTCYQASAYVKTDDMVSSSSFGNEGATMCILFFIKDARTPLVYTTPLVQEERDWHIQKVVFVVPEGCLEMVVSLELRNMKGTAWWDDVTIVELPGTDISKFKRNDQMEISKYGGWKKIKGKTTGFYHTERIGGRWWVIDPEGNGFLVLGVHGVIPHQFGDYLYKRNISKRYKDKREWVEITERRLKEWGFNTVVFSAPEFHGKFAYAAVIAPDLESSRMIQIILPENPHPLFLDVFDRRIKDFLEVTAKKITAITRDDPWLLGYFTANELAWHGIPEKQISLFDLFFALSSERAGKKALVKFLEERYHGEVEVFNKVWGTDITQFAELLVMSRLKGGIKDKKRSWEDESAFVRLVAETYFRTHYEIIKKHDPNHMILGVRFMDCFVPKVVLETIGKYVDIVSFQPYHPIAPLEWIKKSYQLHQKPMLISEFGFKAEDSGLPNTIGAGFTFKTQKDRALWYERYTSFLLSCPITVGQIWFQYVDEPATGRTPDGENGNYGLVTINDEPYADLVKKIKEINHRVYDLATQDINEVQNVRILK